MTHLPDSRSTSSRKSPTQKRGRILLVEDEPILGDSYQVYLEGQGYEVTLCKDGQEALHQFQKNPNKFDLVFTDQVMPQMTGQQLSQELLAHHPQLPIILSTGYRDLLSESEVKMMGIRYLLLKPLQLSVLQKTIEKCLQS